MTHVGQQRHSGEQERHSVTGSNTETVYRYDRAGVQLHGTLTERKVYGPPGYGETPAKDAHKTILILKLLHPISVEPRPNAGPNGSPNLDPAKNVRDVQLFISRSEPFDARKFLGHTAVASGILNEAITASQRTKVWLDVKSLETGQ